MSRFVLSNQRSVVEGFTSHCKKVGFDRFHSVEANDTISVTFFEKLCISNKNYLSNGKEWVATIGTCFYKEKIGEEALSLLIIDSQNRSLNELRSDMKGNYVVLLCKDNYIYIFTDEQGIYTTFYYTNEKSDQWIISSSLYEMVKSSDSNVSLNEFNMLEQVYAFQIFGNETVFDGFKKLLGREYVEVNLNDNIFQIKNWPEASCFEVDTRNSETLASEAADIFKSLASMVHNNFKDQEIALCMTGGLDSRMILSSFMVSGIKPVLYYGTGNSMLTNTHQEDLDVNQMYASKYGLMSKMMDWRTPDKIDEAWDKYIDKYGMSASVYSSSPMVMNSFESVCEKIIFLGAFGEIFRNETIAEHNEGTELLLDDILNGFYFDGDVRTVIGDETKYQEFVSHLKEKFKSFLTPYLNEEDKLPIDKFCFFANEMMSKGHVSMINFLNQQRYCFAILADPELVKKTFVPVSERDDAKFILRVLKRLCPEILDIPIFSRNAWRKYNHEKDCIELLSESLMSKIRLKVSATPVGKHLKAILRPVLRKLDAKENPRNTLTHHYLAEQIQKILDKEKQFDHHIHVVSSEYISKESRYAILLRTLKKAKD